MSDYFDRLLARYTPVAADGSGNGGGGITDAGGTDRVVRIRPRLPGPYERVEALRTAAQEPDAPASLVPSAPQPGWGAAELVEREREVRTDRHTIVRTEAARPGDPVERARAMDPFREVERARPSARPSPAPAPRPGGRDGTADGSRSARRTAQTGAGSAPDIAPAAPAPGASGALRAAVGPPRPRDADTTTARGAAQHGVGRRAPRPAERVVHVQIGRLEVSAAPPPGARAADRPAPAGRRAPVLNLDDYLARGERRN
ncbi:hypothetical protein ACIQ7D_01235 [Streptomyces sp. NPDC096310]|uniref:hypothetical protein n=1 Tax=Streptomyces sp. NPDC096310 TaxID=3366082 RepID=UPI0038299A9D